MVGLRQLLFENKIAVVEDYSKPMLLNSKRKIHYVVFMVNGKEYIFSETDKSYMLSQDYDNICFTENQKVIMKAIKKLIKGNDYGN